jgi:hypothetical protein
MAASGEVTINKHLYKDKMTYQPETELRAFVASESDKFAKIIQEASITLGN